MMHGGVFSRPQNPIDISLRLLKIAPSSGSTAISTTSCRLHNQASRGPSRVFVTVVLVTDHRKNVPDSCTFKRNLTADAVSSPHLQSTFNVISENICYRFVVGYGVVKSVMT